jgi:hypothetical protein
MLLRTQRMMQPDAYLREHRLAAPPPSLPVGVLREPVA